MKNVKIEVTASEVYPYEVDELVDVVSNWARVDRPAWSREDDRELMNYVINIASSLYEISNRTGRTVSDIESRMDYLVPNVDWREWL